MENQNKFEKYKKIELHSPPGKLFTKKEANYIYKEAIRRVEWEMGKEWLNTHDDEEVVEIIIKKIKELAKVYFERQEQENLVDKIVELIVKNIKK